MSATPPTPLEPQDDTPPRSADAPLRTDEVASVSGGTFASNIARCDTHGQYLPHKLPNGSWCTDV